MSWHAFYSWLCHIAEDILLTSDMFCKNRNKAIAMGAEFVTVQSTCVRACTCSLINEYCLANGAKYSALFGDNLLAYSISSIAFLLLWWAAAIIAIKK